MDVVYDIPERLLIDLNIFCSGNDSTTMSFNYNSYRYGLRKQTNGLYLVILRLTSNDDLVDTTKLEDYDHLLWYIESQPEPYK
ncbi:MAG TPA: hypothetical protein VIJ25_10130, partial [Methylococcales bacterium]